MENMEYIHTLKVNVMVCNISQHCPLGDSLLDVNSDSNDGLYDSQCQYKGGLPNPRCCNFL